MEHEFKRRLVEYTYGVVGCMHEVHRKLGMGLNEYIYQEGFLIECNSQGIKVEKEVEVHPTYDGKVMEAYFRLDFLCLDNVVVECKAVEKLSDDNRYQLWNYLRITKHPIGILVNFAASKAQIERYYYDRGANSISAF